MKRILHVSCSPRGTATESYRLARQIIELLQQREPATILGTIGLRDIRFFSVPGPGAAPEVAAAARARVERGLKAHFARPIPSAEAWGEQP